MPQGTEHPTNPCFECNPKNPTLWTMKSTMTCAGACPMVVRFCMLCTPCGCCACVTSVRKQNMRQVGPDTPRWPVFGDRKHNPMLPVRKGPYTERNCAGGNTLPVDSA